MLDLTDLVGQGLELAPKLLVLGRRGGPCSDRRSLSCNKGPATSDALNKALIPQDTHRPLNGLVGDAETFHQVTGRRQTLPRHEITARDLASQKVGNLLVRRPRVVVADAHVSNDRRPVSACTASSQQAIALAVQYCYTLLKFYER